jgi:SAM-dependent methyltransferase
MNPIETVTMWDTRFGVEEYAYGTEPNDSLVEMLSIIESRGLIPSEARVLSLAEGEGRNAIYLGKQGYSVNAMDFSPAGIAKLQSNIAALGLADKVTTEVADLREYDFLKAEPAGWDIIICIFAILPSDLKKICADQIRSSLKPGGYYIQVSYHPDNIGRGTGGPQIPDLCTTKEMIQVLYGEGFELLKLNHMDRLCNEGKYHNGLASVIEVLAQKRTSA